MATVIPKVVGKILPKFSYSARESLAHGGGLPSAPGSKSGLELNAPVTSRKWRPSPKPTTGGAITIVGGTYSLAGGAFTATAGTWGTSSYILLKGTTSDQYETTTTPTVTIDGVAYEFSLTTKVDPASVSDVTFDGDSVTFDGDPAVIW